MKAFAFPARKAAMLAKVKLPGIAIGVVVVEAAQLTAKLERVVAAQVVKRIRNNKGGVRSTLRKSGGTAHVESRHRQRLSAASRLGR